MKTSEKIRNLWDRFCWSCLYWTTKEDFDALADEVAELEKQRVPDGWMPYWLIHEVTEDEVWVQPDGWWLEPGGDPEKATLLGDSRLPWQEAIARAEAAKEETV